MSPTKKKKYKIKISFFSNSSDFDSHPVKVFFFFLFESLGLKLLGVNKERMGGERRKRRGEWGGEEEGWREGSYGFLGELTTSLKWSSSEGI